jgi:hypothetical protein
MVEGVETKASNGSILDQGAALVVPLDGTFTDIVWD